MPFQLSSQHNKEPSGGKKHGPATYVRLYPLLLNPVMFILPNFVCLPHATEHHSGPDRIRIISDGPEQGKVGQNRSRALFEHGQETTFWSEYGSDIKCNYFAASSLKDVRSSTCLLPTDTLSASILRCSFLASAFLRASSCHVAKHRLQRNRTLWWARKDCKTLWDDIRIQFIHK